MSKIPWISDQDLDSAIKKFVSESCSAKTDANKRMVQNVIDPFSSLIIASIFNISTKEELINIQQTASGLGGISQALGKFHQRVLGSVSDWVEHDASYDLECPSRRIVAEIKNKHNTMNSKTRDKVTAELDSAVQIKGKGWEAYLVITIPRKPKRYKKQIHMTRPVYEIDGASFYTLVTGYDDAIHSLFRITNDILDDILNPLSNNVSTYCNSIMERFVPE